MSTNDFPPQRLAHITSQQPLDKLIPARNISFNIHEAYDPAWLGGDGIFSAVFDAFSIMLPDGERFFIRAVNQYVADIYASDLRSDIQAFSLQEAYHTREHEIYNRLIQETGFPLDDAYTRVKAMLSLAKSQITRLSVTVAIEHLTACFGELVFNHKLVENARRPYRDLWTWHALEEIEHRAVAFALFKRVSTRLFPIQVYLLRCLTLLIVTYKLGKLHTNLALEILEYRGQIINLSTRIAVFRAMFGPRGPYRLAFGTWLRFFAPGFSPTTLAEPQNLALWREYFDKMAVQIQSAHHA